MIRGSIAEDEYANVARDRLRCSRDWPNGPSGYKTQKMSAPHDRPRFRGETSNAAKTAMNSRRFNRSSRQLEDGGTHCITSRSWSLH